MIYRNKPSEGIYIMKTYKIDVAKGVTVKSGLSAYDAMKELLREMGVDGLKIYKIKDNKWGLLISTGFDDFVVGDFRIFQNEDYKKHDISSIVVEAPNEQEAKRMIGEAFIKQPAFKKIYPRAVGE